VRSHPAPVPKKEDEMFNRTFYSPSMLDEMERLQREMNRLFEGALPGRVRSAPGYPAMNIWTNQDGVLITAEVPGVHPQDIEISVIGETLTLSGERRAPDVAEDVRFHRQERGYGKFSRSIELPFRVDAEKVQATFDQGVLQISLPHLPEDKPKKIAVKVTHS
jgi:HSP20 family protein